MFNRKFLVHERRFEEKIFPIFVEKLEEKEEKHLTIVDYKIMEVVFEILSDMPSEDYGMRLTLEERVKEYCGLAEEVLGKVDEERRPKEVLSKLEKVKGIYIK